MRGEIINGGGAARAAGFTIIEVMLFLAISGALVVALLATVGLNISRQRFTDSETGLQGFLQEQYNSVLNVVNDRQGGGSCTDASGTTATGSGSLQAGQSNCVILGEAIDFNQGSSTLTIHNVVGTEPAPNDPNTGGQLLADYHPGLDTTGSSTFDIAWGATVTGSKPDGTSRILLLRAPDSGLVLSFPAGGGASLSPALVARTQTTSVCIRSADILNTYSTIAIAPVAGSEGVTATQENAC